MITMQVCDKDMTNTGELDSVSPQLDLCTFSAIKQKNPLTSLKQVSGQEFFGSWNR
jgi:hypothetical protein